MELVHPTVENYAANYSSALDELLEEVVQYTIAKHPKQHMLSGKVQGKLLEWISIIKQPEYILEIGTFTGFSALCLAKGLTDSGELHTIEIREEDAKTAQSFFNKSTYTKKIKLHIGNALEIIPNLDYKWDIVFIDADKVSYSNYYDLILPRLNEDGIIIVDNVFFHGAIFDDEIKSKNAIAIAAFNEKIQMDNTVEKIMLTIRDGLYLIRKK